MTARIIKNGESLAIATDAIKSGLHAGRHAMWWDAGPPVEPNEVCSGVCVVHIRGSLEHHADPYGGDSYDCIRARVADAMTSDGCSAVILRIDSPGGVVSGLNETVRAISSMRAKHGRPLYGYVDELATSAAYALACACDEIYLPKSGIAGSIGVISTMYEQTRADRKMGLNFVTLVSGARKADGHPHVPISQDTIDVEQGRVDRLAKQFYAIVSRARGLSPSAIRGLEAGIFLGREAVSAELADGILTWDQMLAGAQFGDFSIAQGGTPSVPSKNSVAREGIDKQDPPDGAKGERGMLIKLRAMIARLEARKAAATSTASRKAIDAQLTSARADLVAATKIKKKTEEYSEESDDAEDDEEESEESKGNETDRKEDGDGDDDKDDSSGELPDDEDDEESAESEETEEEAAAAPPMKKGSKAILSLVAKATGGATGARAVGRLSALLTKADQFDGLQARVAKIESSALTSRKMSMIDEAVAQRRITRHEAKHLRTQRMSFVLGTLDMRKKAIVNVDDDSIRVPDPSAKGPALDSGVMAQIDLAVRCSPDGIDKTKLRAEMIDAHEKRMAKANGAAEGRY